ncbi:Tmemb_14 domain-containing protein [Cephalotus follicularis]|uniref:Tmemb_14 domain-containing protein n=1 Tax=Cephalotus follicularis TaxID=3775 RepID=A0A1Q3BP25_CEPFO|nr:Tmemb_14 domain-containing protein [Cephalotus follicularis]
MLVGLSSQSSLLLQQPKLGGFPNKACCYSAPSTLVFFSHRQQQQQQQRLHFKGIFACGVVSSDSRAPTIFTNPVDSAEDGIDYLPDIGSGGGDKFGELGSGGGGGGGGKSGGGGGSGDDSSKKKKNMALSMSQKLTLGYAVLVGVGGVMGYLKSGSQKSLLAGGLSASLLYYVYTQLPVQPVFASSLGLGISAALLGVMGSRFKRSGKIFPAGVVSLISLVMAGGYLHGILRSMH